MSEMGILQQLQLPFVRATSFEPRFMLSPTNSLKVVPQEGIRQYKCEENQRQGMFFVSNGYVHHPEGSYRGHAKNHNSQEHLEWISGDARGRHEPKCQASDGKTEQDPKNQLHHSGLPVALIRTLVPPLATANKVSICIMVQ
jgi:hypothetical protein